MTRKQLWRTTCASLALASMAFNTVAVAAEPALTLATSKGSVGEQFAQLPASEVKLTATQKIALIKQKIRLRAVPGKSQLR